MIRPLFLLLAFGTVLQAQSSDATGRTPADSVIARARRLGAQGREAEGRRVIDSVLKIVSPDSPVFAEALYARASLATTAVDAERDYRRLLIEAPLSGRAEDAMLQLAQLLQARGDRRGASDHLQKFMLTYPESPARPRVALSLVRLLFDLGPQQQARACEALRLGRDAIPTESLELRNQLEFYAPRCATVVAEAPATTAATDTTPVIPPTTSSPASAPAAATTAGSSPAPAAQAAYYSVQLAAYNSREPATNLANLLVERGLEARVDGAVAPYRVRVGRYATRADAVKAAAALKAQGHNGFVTLVQGGR